MNDHDELFRDVFNRRCTREACNKPPVAWDYGAGDRDPQACIDHLTPEETQALRLARERTLARLQRLAQEPDCWSWPVPSLPQDLSEEAQTEALHHFQRGRGCAICSVPGDLVEDHDHETGLVRGNLCQSCNVREGKGDATPPFVKYRERNPAAILGVKVRYWSPFTGWAEPAPPPIPREVLRAAVERLNRP
ncbi:endonuclease domain-containing protein [Actinomadura madurae]|uniref:endonuclease domain-containing protein n=1 Tax=Actinomadura madurae TaxID=1993 RepID=UPI0020D23E6A|nr:endonuclease domain-containing protein [Actinomadura madurae]MCQ0011956.1 endonuclease VII domain-containing protein [Actinomadura madurae]